MKFMTAVYVAEMKGMIDEAIHKMTRENSDFEIYTATGNIKRMENAGAGWSLL
jgi:hypothetical protein